MRKRALRCSGLGLVLLLQSLTLPSRALACVVGTGSGTCTESALNACLLGGGSFDGTVTFNCGGAATITVTSTKTISADTTIDGGSPSLITLSGGHSVSVFSVNTGIKFTVQSLTISNGTSAFGGGIANGGINGNGSFIGGGTVTVTNCIFSSNTAASGGAIINSGRLTVTNSTFSGNISSDDSGGAGAIGNGGTLTITNSTFSGNSASDVGGGIAMGNGGTLTITNSTFSGNSATNGGGAIVWGVASGVAVSGTLTITNSTFFDNNSASLGGAISNSGTLTITNSTFSGNSASDASGGISNSNGTVTVINTILSTSVNNCTGGSITDGGHNIDDDGSCGFSSGITNPQLDPAGLQNNGGPTQTIALCSAAGVPSAGCAGASPAINAGNESVCSQPRVSNLDQRGYTRPGVGETNCSIGAYEYNAVPAPATLTSTITPTDTCIPVSDTSIFSPTGGYALIGSELVHYSGLGTSCGGASVARASAGTAATPGGLTGVTRNLNGQGGAHAAGTTVTPTAAPCVGDCDGRGQVTVDEILTMVNIALGNADISTCTAGDPNGDHQITVDEILMAVNNALNGCPAS